MEIVKYNEKKKVLSMKFNTDVIWKYNGVDKKAYDKLTSAKSLEKAVKDLLHKPLIVGTHKEVK
jgi:uncharacterized iron-regulated protein